MNPCPCGALGSPNGSCRCNPETIRRYHSKISGPILDRIDMRVAVPFQNYRVISGPRDEEGMKKIREEVSRARSIQQKRFSSEGLKCRVNAQMSEKSIEKFCKTTDGGKKTLESAVDRFGLSARAYTRILKVARTIADMESEEIIDERHICEALQFRFENLFFVGAEKYCA
jgi:magnesium chelatase family protein